MPPDEWSVALDRARVVRIVTIQLAAAICGIAFVLVYLGLLFPLDDLSRDETTLGLNLIAFSAYISVTLLIAAPVNIGLKTKALRWMPERRTPTRTERIKVLGLPAFGAAFAFAGWLGGALLFGVINDNTVRMSVAIALAGLTTSAVVYLLLERNYRPIVALALEGARPPSGRREILPRLMLAWALGAAAPLIGLGVAIIGMPAEQLTDMGARITAATLLSVAAGGLLMRATASAVALPVEDVREAMSRVQDGDLDAVVRVTNVGELGRLQAGFNAMVSGLRERRHLHELLGQQVGNAVADRHLAAGGQLGGELREVTVMFVDLAGFTAFAETHDPHAVIDELNAFFAVVVERVMARGGLVNKFEGDAALCVFGAPLDQPDHARCALDVASGLPAAIAAVTAIGVGIGVATGTAVAGDLGTPQRYEYTVIGDVVNLAARLADLAKHEAGSVLVAASTCEAAGGPPGWHRRGAISVRGRAAEVEVATRVPLEV